MGAKRTEGPSPSTQNPQAQAAHSAGCNCRILAQYPAPGATTLQFASRKPSRTSSPRTGPPPPSPDRYTLAESAGHLCGCPSLPGRPVLAGEAAGRCSASSPHRPLQSQTGSSSPSTHISEYAGAARLQAARSTFTWIRRSVVLQHIAGAVHDIPENHARSNPRCDSATA